MTKKLNTTRESKPEAATIPWGLCYRVEGLKFNQEQIQGRSDSLCHLLLAFDFLLKLNRTKGRTRSVWVQNFSIWTAHYRLPLSETFFVIFFVLPSKDRETLGTGCGRLETPVETKRQRARRESSMVDTRGGLANPSGLPMTAPLRIDDWSLLSEGQKKKKEKYINLG